MNTMDRREFLVAAGTLAGLAGCSRPDGAAIIDFHQHTHYLGRSDADLVAHQRKLGVAKTVLLPAGSRYGLAADAWGNDSVVKLARSVSGGVRLLRQRAARPPGDSSGPGKAPQDGRPGDRRTEVQVAL